MKKTISLLLMLVMICSLFSACTGKSAVNPALDIKTPVTLKVVGPWKDFPALTLISDMFTQKYENCTVEYEFVQDYYASIEKRMTNDADSIDLFVSLGIQSNSAMLPFALDLYSDERVDLSDAFPGLVQNFEFYGTEGDAKKIYAVPLGAELRGMYVNKTLLTSLGIAVPATLSQFTAACDKLLENGYIPLQGNPGVFAQTLMYPYVCNIIANADDVQAAHDKVNSRAAGVSELFNEPMSLLYSFVEKGYYDYKKIENETGMFKDTTNEAITRDFLNIIEADDGTFTKKDDVGTVAFMPSTLSLSSVIDQIKTDYHSTIEYEFILSPMTEEGGFAYMSPAHGIAINKNTAHLDWAIEFFNYIFTADNNKQLAKAHNITPNTEDAFSIISKQFNVSENHISHVGEVSFDYGFYALIQESLTEIAKCNNPKYMANDGTELYPLDYYMENLEKRLTTVE